jgi:hypothetical protein
MKTGYKPVSMGFVSWKRKHKGVRGESGKGEDVVLIFHINIAVLFGDDSPNLIKSKCEPCMM